MWPRTGRVLERDVHLLEVNLTLGYPRRAPQCRMLTPVFHPNFDDSVVCIGDFWAASEGLDQLIIRIGRMISYQEYNTKSPLNGLAAKWAAQNYHPLPSDPRPVAPPLNGAQKAPVPEEGEKPAPVQFGPGVPTTAEDQWSEKIVISPEHSGVSNPPPAAPPPLSTFSNPTVSNAAELKTEFAVLPKEDRFFRWRLVLFFTLLAILSGRLLWYGFQRQAQVPLPVPTRKLPAGATKPAGANARRSAGLDPLLEKVMQLPGSSNTQALGAEDNARKSMQAGHRESAFTSALRAGTRD